jgi:CRISPR-associated protein Cas2
MLEEQPMRNQPYLICYDIRNPKRLVKVHKIACKTATAVQYSVFYAELGQPAVDALMEDFNEVIDPRVDDIRIYSVASFDQAAIIGETPADKGIYAMISRKKRR